MFGLILIKRKTLKSLLDQHRNLAYEAGLRSRESATKVPCLAIQEAASILWLEERRKGEL